MMLQILAVFIVSAFYQMMMQFKSTGYCKISLDDLRYSLALFDKYDATKDLKNV